MITIEDAKKYIQSCASKRGTDCPVCDQFVKIYRRSISSPMAWVLLKMHQELDPTAWTEIKAFIETLQIPKSVHRTATGGGDTVKLTHWGLIEPQPDLVRNDGSYRTGFYRITEQGQKYVRGEILLPKYAFTYAGVCIGYSDGTYSKAKYASIEDSLKKKFNYQEIMGGP